ncbi:MAG: hypothetical protein JXP34_27805 [Planctomycetes bacterium]|nr:hypothetical protein [Planctomycetota bacterium]
MGGMMSEDPGAGKIRTPGRRLREASVAEAGTYRVGPERQAKSLGAVAGKLAPGDTALVDPGTYREVLKITASGTKASPIAIRGAGIRLLRSTNAVIRDCEIGRCDMGIMDGNRVVVRHCHIHDAIVGQDFKSRAHDNKLWYNWIADSEEGETDRPDSHTLLAGNVIVSKPDRKGNRAKYVIFGSESGRSHDGTLFLFHNTFISGSPRIVFVQLADPGFVDLAKRNFRPSEGSPCLVRGATDLEYLDGEGARLKLVIDIEGGGIGARLRAPAPAASPR